MENDVEATASKEFLEKRRHGIGGSDVAAIMGISPFKSCYEVWHEKVYGSKFLSRIDDLGSSSVILELGHVLEPYIAMKYAQSTGRTLIACKEPFIHVGYEFMAANPDRIIARGDNADGILEIKTKGAYTDWGGHDIPPYYMTQVQHYLSVLDLDWASFVYLDLGKREINYFDIKRDDACIDNIIDIEIEFWELVKNKTPPHIDNSKSTNTFIRDMYEGDAEIGVIDLTDDDDILGFVDIIGNARIEKKEIEELETGAKTNLMSIMGNAEKAVGDGFSITWKAPKDKVVFDIDAFKSDHLELYKKYTSPKPQSRRFMVRIDK